MNNLIVAWGTRLITGSNGNKLNPMGAIRRRAGGGYVIPCRLNDWKGVGPSVPLGLKVQSIPWLIASALCAVYCGEEPDKQ